MFGEGRSCPNNIMIVGICKLTLHFPATQSLKDKRRILHKIKDRAASRFHVQIAEVGDQELWQKAQLGFALTGNSKVDIESLIQKLILFIEGLNAGEILNCEKEIIHF